MFGVGILASCVQSKFHSTDTGDKDFSLAPSVFTEQAQMARQVVARAVDCDHDEMTVDPMASLVIDRAVDAGGQTLPVLIATDEGVRIPISTATELETFYSVRKPAPSITVVTPSASPSTEECSVAVVTETQTIVSTVTMIPTTTEGYATVTGEPSTVTNINTDTAYTEILPDVTVSGDPLTLTNIRTDLSYTSALPDVTISGNPSTVTEVDMSYSLTSPVATSVKTVVVTDLWGTRSPGPMTTVTTLSDTSESTLTTTLTAVTPIIVTVSGLYPPPGEDDGSSTTYYTSAAKGGGLSRTAAPYPTNGTVIVGPSGTVTGYPTVDPTTLPTAAGPKKPEPLFGNSNGSSHLGCAVMLIVLSMYMI